MKKVLSLTALVLALGAMPLLSQAESACTTDAGGPALACVTIDGNESGGFIYADGDSSNPDPLDGYARLGANADGSTSCNADDDGSFGDDDGAVGPEDDHDQTCEEAVNGLLP